MRQEATPYRPIPAVVQGPDVHHRNHDAAGEGVPFGQRDARREAYDGVRSIKAAADRFTVESTGTALLSTEARSQINRGFSAIT